MSSTKTTPRSLEAVDDQLVVDDLVVAVHGRLEDPHHPRQRLDRHLHAGAEARGAASSTRSTSTPSRLPIGPYAGLPLTAMSAAAGRWRWRPGRPPPRAGLPPGDEIAGHGRPGAPRHHRVPACSPTSAELELDVRRGGLELTVDVDKARRRAARRSRCDSALFDQVRTCDNHCEFCFIYQLPPGPAAEPVPEGRRLPAVASCTGTSPPSPASPRPTSSGWSPRGSRPLNVSIHATDPDVRARDAAQPAGRDEPALAAGPARPRHRGARPGRGVPGRQRRRGARRHAGRRARPSTPSWPAVARRAARRQPVQHRAGDAAAHRRRRRPRWSTRSRTGRTSSCAALGRRLVFAADEYYLLAGRPFPERRRLRGLRACTRTASAWRAPSSSSSPGRGRAASTGVRSGFFAWPLDGARPADGVPRAGLRGARSVRPITPRRSSARRAGAPVGILTGEYGAAVLGAAASLARSRRRPGRAGAPTSSSAATRRSPACWSAPTWPGSLADEPAGTATCCPTCACPAAGSSTAPRSPTCPDRSRSSPTDGAALRRALAALTVTSLPIVAVVGRPNVGKSTLRQPHRRPPRGDRRGAPGRHARPQGGRGRVARPRFPLVDTGGWLPGGNALDEQGQPPGRAGDGRRRR